MKKLILATMLCLGFAGVTVAQPAFESADIGSPGAAGSAVAGYDGTVTVSGGGTDIWGANDHFHFAYVEQHGDFDMVARIVSMSGGDNAWRKFGVMVRDTLDDNAVHAFMAGTADEGVRWQGRRVAGTDQNGNAAAVPGYPDPFVDTSPYYVRISRSEDGFAAYASWDGVNWDMAPDNIVADGTGEHIENPHPFNMSDPVYVGLAVTAHDDDGTEDELTTVTFDNVMINGLRFGGDAWGATNFDPAPGAVEVPVGVYALGWDTVVPEGSTIRDYKVYFGTDPNLQEADLLGTAVDSTIESPVLDSDVTYYWRVASYIDDSNFVKGLTWQFTTISYGPGIVTQPEDVVYGPACQPELSVVAEPLVPGEGGDIHYAWYRVLEGDDEQVGTDSDTLLPAVDGEYYCVVWNDAASVTSNVVAVAASVHADASGRGSALFERFAGQQPGADSMLTADSADRVAYEVVSTSEWGRGETGLDDYRGRITLWLTPAATGAYQFRIAADDNCRLWLSPNSDPAYATRIAGFDGWADIDVWDSYASQTSAEVSLVEGRSYFLRAGYDEGGGGDHVHVQWRGPGFDWQNISGEAMNLYPGESWAARSIVLSPLDENGWVKYDSDLTVSWAKATYGPCDAVYTLYLSQDQAAVSDPNADGVLAFETSDLSVVVPDVGTLDLEHDQTWYYRIDVSSETAADDEIGQVYSFDTVKWVPLVGTQPPASIVAPMPSDVTISFTPTALNDDFAALMSYTWYRIVGAKDTESEETDDEVIFTNDDPIETNREGGKRYYDASVVLSFTELGHEGVYYCVATNQSGDVVSSDCLLLARRKVLHYSFESLNGNTVPDSSPTGADGTLKSPLAWANRTVIGGIEPGMIGNAIRLVGGEDPNAAYVDSGKTAYELGIEGARPRSVSVWAKTGDMARSGIYSVGEYTSMRAFGVHNANDPGNNFVYQFDHWGSNFDYADFSAFDNWVHIVHVYDGANVRIYVDGVKVADYAAPDINTAAGGQPFAVGFWGAYDAGFQHGVFNGLIDEFALYNYALSPLEIGQLYIAGAGGTVCVETPQYDLTGDCQVDLEDFAIFAASWAESSLVSP